MRRQITVPSIAACQDNALDDPQLFRLPRNKPRAICRKWPSYAAAPRRSNAWYASWAVDDSEFTTDAEKAACTCTSVTAARPPPARARWPTAASSAPTNSLLDSLDKMKGYDMVLLGCEGTDNIIEGRPETQYFNVRDYADQGGRIFGSHYHDKFIWNDKTEDKPYPEVVKFQSGRLRVAFARDRHHQHHVPQRRSLGDWLVYVKASHQARANLDRRRRKHRSEHRAPQRHLVDRLAPTPRR